MRVEHEIGKELGVFTEKNQDRSKIAAAYQKLWIFWSHLQIGFSNVDDFLSESSVYE